MKKSKHQELKQSTVVSFKKARSLLAKIIKMVEEDAYCIDIMQQNLAVMGLLRSAHQRLMENHLKSCFQAIMTSSNQKKRNQAIEEILRVTDLFNR